MDPTSLRMFRAVAQAGSVAAAAAEVGSVPSNLSVRIRKLEEELGVELFLRETRGMRLTPPGERLLHYAERLLALGDEARTAVREMAGEAGALRLSAMETTAAMRLPPILARFHAAHPRISLNLSTATTEASLMAVLDRRVDMAFVAGPINDPLLEGEPVFVEELALIAPVTVRSLDEADKRMLLTFKPGCAYRARMEHWLRSRGERPAGVMEMGTLDGVLGCIAAGMGVTLLPRAVIERAPWQGTLTALPIEGGRVETWLIRHKDASLSLAAQAFLATVRDMGQRAAA